MTNTLPVAGWRDDCGSRQPSLRNGRAAQCAQERLAKTGAQLAAIMADWHHAQRRALDQPDFSFRPPIAAAGPAAAMHPPIEARIADAAEAPPRNRRDRMDRSLPARHLPDGVPGRRTRRMNR